MLSGVRSRSCGRKSCLIWTLLAPYAYINTSPPKFRVQTLVFPSLAPPDTSGPSWTKRRRRPEPTGMRHVALPAPRHRRPAGTRIGPSRPARPSRRPPSPLLRGRVRRPPPTAATSPVPHLAALVAGTRAPRAGVPRRRASLPTPVSSLSARPPSASPSPPATSPAEIRRDPPPPRFACQIQREVDPDFSSKS